VSLLEGLNGPADLKKMDEQQLGAICAELRREIIATVARTGGHLGSSLGVVELTVALHRLLDSPTDRIVWDTGHQAYPHKLLTGRLGRFGTLRQIDGVGGFPRREESPHDVMDGGHAGTGVSIAQGLALARDQRGSTERVVAVVGDAALMSGLSLEALNDLGHRKTRLVVVLNDNEMSISPTVGAVSGYLSKIKLSRTWRDSREAYDNAVERIPAVGSTLLEWSRRFRGAVVDFAQDGRLFEDLGITYVGPVDGHDLAELQAVFGTVFDRLDGPVVVHVRTQKGRGYRPAEADQVSFHGAALPPMDLTEAGLPPITTPAAPEPASGRRSPNYTAVISDELVAIGREDARVVAITAGMPTGTGLSKFGQVFPDRFIDVGIAEQHAMTVATGLALAGQRPFVALYSTFLQRAYDQVVHDVCQNDAPVVIGVDRAGLVGEDGTSHQGMFTLSAQRTLPYLVIASPKDEQEARSLLRTAFAQPHPFALHYPRDAGFDLPSVEPALLPIGKGEVIREGSDLAIIGFGPIVMRGMEAAERLGQDGWSVAVANARFAKPLDGELIRSVARGKRLVITLEESALPGGFGSAVVEELADAGLTDASLRGIPVLRIGIPAGEFVHHGAVGDLRRLTRLDVDGIVGQVEEALVELGIGTLMAAAGLDERKG